MNRLIAVLDDIAYAMRAGHIDGEIPKHWLYAVEGARGVCAETERGSETLRAADQDVDIAERDVNG